MSPQTFSAALCEDSLAVGWKSILGETFRAPYMQSLREFLDLECAAGETVLPGPSHVLRALQMVDYDDVKVVVLGQDPYHGDAKANGLAFAVNAGLPVPPSLRNIFKELNADVGSPAHNGTSLLGWARQGVLLLNTVLTVRAHQAFSHRGQGWEQFTDEILCRLNEHRQPLVFMLWGSPAHKKERLITRTHHLILKAAHPSPLSAHRGFLGCRHFSQANDFLVRTGRQIDWLRVNE